MIWEPSVIIQLPPWVALLYPSALFLDFNIDLEGTAFLPFPLASPLCLTLSSQTSSLSQHLRESCPLLLTHALHEADSEGRGSLVFFNQASLFQSSETDSATLAEARRAGRSTTTDYGEDAQAAFSNSMFFHSLHDPSVATPRPPLP